MKKASRFFLWLVKRIFIYLFRKRPSVVRFMTFLSVTKILVTFLSLKNRKDFTLMLQNLQELWQSWSSFASTLEMHSMLCLLISVVCLVIIITCLWLILSKLKQYSIPLIRLVYELLKKLGKKLIAKLPLHKQPKAEQQLQQALKVLQSVEQELKKNEQRLFSVRGESDGHNDSAQ